MSKAPLFPRLTAMPSMWEQRVNSTHLPMFGVTCIPAYFCFRLNLSNTFSCNNCINS